MTLDGTPIGDPAPPPREYQRAASPWVGGVDATDMRDALGAVAEAHGWQRIIAALRRRDGRVRA